MDCIHETEPVPWTTSTTFGKSSAVYEK